MAENLFSSPVRLFFYFSRWRVQFADLGFPEEFQGIILRYLIFAVREQKEPCDVVVNASYDRSSEPWGQDIFLHMHQDLCFSQCFLVLRYVHVHLVAVKV